MTETQRLKAIFAMMAGVWFSMLLVFPKEVLWVIFDQILSTRPYWPVFILIGVSLVLFGGKAIVNASTKCHPE